MLRAIKKTRIYEEIIGQIQELIKAGKLKAGDKLPPERELAEAFKVSRTSVREAIRALETQGLVVSHPGSGTFINAPSTELIVQPLAALLYQEKDTLVDIFEMRRMVEPHIAALAAERATPQDILQLKNILEDQQQQIASGASGVEADTRFHLSIAEATQNKVLRRLVSIIIDILGPSREKSLQTRGRSRKSLAAHHDVLAAIVEHDPQKAQAAMQRHIKEVERTILLADS
jgi:GntR family transcriptional repressor for pyruvate dehydrogenase complex